MLDGKVIASLCLKVPLCSEDVSALFSYTEQIRAEGFRAGAASRDAYIEQLELALLQVRKAICGDIHNTDDLLDLIASRDAEVAKWNTAYTSAAEVALRLSLERDQLRTEMNEWRGQAHRSQSDADRLKEENDRLRAQINVLREALEPFCDGDIPDDDAPENYVSSAKQALTSTPEQSLAEYRNKVIEECAAVLNVAITRLSSCGASIKNDVAISTLKEQSCRLRAMKEQP